MNVSHQLRTEINRMERDLRDRSRKLDLLRSALLHYESLNAPPARGAQTKVEAVRKNVIEMLRDGPKHRQDILKNLAEKNILDPNDDGMNYLATRLSMWDDTATDGHGNWRLNHSQ